MNRVGPGALRERGMVTAEAAVCLIGLVTIALGLVWVIALVAQQVRCQDAARDVARAVARGESATTSRAEGLRTAPEGARIDIRIRDGLATVTVEIEARPPWPMPARLPPVVVRARAVVAVEPGVGGPAARPPSGDPFPPAPALAVAPVAQPIAITCRNVPPGAPHARRTPGTTLPTRSPVSTRRRA